MTFRKNSVAVSLRRVRFIALQSFKFQDDARPCYHCPYRRSDFDIVDLQKIYGGKIFFSQKRFFRARGRRRAILARSARAVLHSVFTLG